MHKYTQLAKDREKETPFCTGGIRRDVGIATLVDPLGESGPPAENRSTSSWTKARRSVGRDGEDDSNGQYPSSCATYQVYLVRELIPTIKCINVSLLTGFGALALLGTVYYCAGSCVNE